MSAHHPLRGPVSDALHQFPLRLRLVAVTVGLLIAALAVAGLAASYRLENFVVQQKSQELHSAAGGVVEQVYERLPQRVTAPTAATYGGYAVAIMPRGERAGFTGGSLPNVPAISPQNPYVSSHRSFVVRSNDNQTRWLATAYATSAGDTTVVVAAPLASADETVQKMRWSTVVISLIAAAISALLGWFLIRRAFRPLSTIEDTAKAIAAGDLTQRVPAITTRDEVSSLASSLNVMLGRIEDSFAIRTASEDRMRRFVSDASHELRTPLATVRGYAELYRQGAVTEPKDVAATMNRIEGEAIRMSGLVDDLLLLNRIDRGDTEAGYQALDPRPVDLTVLGAEAVQDARVRDPQRSIRLSGWDGPMAPTTVHGDEAQLRQVLTNLLTNALRYSPAHSPVEVLVGRSSEGPQAGSPLLAVRDHGPGIPVDQRAKVFERFYRAEASRNTALGGSGLGLAIVKAIVDAHGGAVRLTDTPGGGATFMIHFPQPDHSNGPDPVQQDGIE